MLVLDMTINCPCNINSFYLKGGINMKEFSVILEEYYPKTMKKQHELKKNNNHEMASRLLAYANKMQHMVYYASHTDNSELAEKYIQNARECYCLANEYYAESIMGR